MRHTHTGVPGCAEGYGQLTSLPGYCMTAQRPVGQAT
jgi:hypothetical protein